MPPSSQEVETLTPPLTLCDPGGRLNFSDPPGSLEKELVRGLCELESVKPLAPFGPRQVLIRGNFVFKTLENYFT